MKKIIIFITLIILLTSIVFAFDKTKIEDIFGRDIEILKEEQAIDLKSVECLDKSCNDKFTDEIGLIKKITYKDGKETKSLYHVALG